VVSSYIDILVKQIEGIKFSPSTIYIGGGTPSALDMKPLTKLFKALQVYAKDTREFTVEANPESLDINKIKLFIDSGVNRLSIGVQSLKDDKLKKLGRIHNAARAIDAVTLASKNGFKNIGIDLMFGLWGEKIDSWQKELKAAARLPINHLSCYELTYEKNTPLFDALKNKSIEPLEDEEVAAMYEMLIDELGLAGIKQYEVSNFAKEGFECRHNMNYWENNEYLGLGPSAVSYIEGRRSKNISDISEYVKRFNRGESIVESVEELSPVRRAKETAAVKIRTREGIKFEWFKTKTGFDFLELEKKALKDMIEKELIKYIKEGNDVLGVVLKRKGFLFCDTVSSAFL